MLAWGYNQNFDGFDMIKIVVIKNIPLLIISWASSKLRQSYLDCGLFLKIELDFFSLYSTMQVIKYAMCFLVADIFLQRCSGPVV